MTTLHNAWDLYLDEMPGFRCDVAVRVATRDDPSGSKSTYSFERDRTSKLAIAQRSEWILFARNRDYFFELTRHDDSQPWTLSQIGLTRDLHNLTERLIWEQALIRPRRAWPSIETD